MWIACAAAVAWALESFSPGLWLVGACLGTLVAALVCRNDHHHQAALEARVAFLEESVRRLSEALESLRAGGFVSAAVPAAAPEHAVPAAAPQAALDPTPAPAPEAAAPGPSTQRARREAPERPRPSQGVFARLFYGTALAKVGAALLLIALGSLLKLTAEYLQASVEARLAGVALLALGLAVAGWRQRGARPRIALALQGAGLAVFYFLAWLMGPGFRPWSSPALVDGGASLALLVGVAAVCGALAWIQGSRILAVAAIAGAFIAPFAAFTAAAPRSIAQYCLLLDLAIAGASLARNARSLNLASFAATLIALAAAVTSPVASRAAPIPAVELALLAVLYSLVPVAFARVRGARLGHPADATLVFGVPALALAAGAAGAQPGMAAALAAFLGGAYYFTLSWVLRVRGRNPAAMAEAHAMIGLALVTLAAPLAFGVTATAMILAAEGVLVAWYGLRGRRDLFAATGLAIHLGAGLYFLLHAGALDRRIPVLNEIFAGCFVLALAAFAASNVLRRHAPERTAWAHLATPLGILGALWWFGGSVSEIARWVPRGDEWAAILGFVGVIALGMELFGGWRQWQRTRVASATFAVVLVLFSLVSAGVHGHVMAGWMAWVFPSSTLLCWWMLGRHERARLAVPLTVPHAVLAWLLAVAIALEGVWLARASAYVHVWQAVVWGATFTAFAIAIFVLCVGRLWPARGREAQLMRYCGLPAVAAGIAWVMYANASSTGEWGYAYVPVFNPLDITSTFILAIGTWMLAAARRIDPRLPPGACQGLAWALAAGKFWWANATVARTVHHYTGMPYTLAGMLESVALQAILSVVWTISALAVMVWGTRAASRTTWFVGFGLLAVVGLKMVLFDLRHLGSASWTFSLLGISVVVMAAGYFTPTPPRRAESMA